MSIFNRRNSVAVSSVLLIGTLGATGASAGAQAAPINQTHTSTVGVKVGYYPLAEPERIAQREGWFQQSFGEPVTWSTFQDGADMIAAMTSGAIDVACGVGVPPLVSAAAQGLKIQAFWIVDNSAESLAVNPSKISSISGLVGKKIGTIVGSTMYLSLVATLEANHIPVSKVDIVNGGGVSDLVAAYERGDLDGVYLPYPGLEQVTAKGAKVLLTSDEVAKRYGYAAFDACVALNSWEATHRALLTKWVSVENRAVLYYRNHPSSADQIMGSSVGISAAAARTETQPYVFPSAAEQATSTWLGTAATAKRAGVTKTISLTATILHGLGDISTTLANPSAVENPTYVDSVAKR